MRINLFLIPFVIIMGWILGLHDSKKNRLLYIILCYMVLIFVAAMRNPEFMTEVYGIDTLNYKGYFDNSFNMSWREIWINFVDRYVRWEGESDIGFTVLNKVISYFTHDFYIYSIIVDMLFFIPLGIILYRYCTNMWQIVFAFVFYLAMLQIMLLSGGRQNIAVGFDLMAFLSIIDNRKLRAIILWGIGVFIHFSSILFIIPLLMIWFNLGARLLKFIHVVFFIIFPIVYLYPNEIIVFMGNTIGMEKYANYGEGMITGGAITFVIMIELLSLFCFFAVKISDMQNNKYLRYLYVMAPLFTLLAPLISADGAMIRVSFYYHLFLMLLVPYSIECMFDRKSQRFAYFVAIGVLSLLTVSSGGIRYYFYWQMWM